MKKIKLILISLALLIGAGGVASAGVVYASPASEIRGGVNAVGGGGSPALGTQLKTVVNIMLYILGAIAVIMIVVGGIRYTTSNGDSSSTKAAKDTVLYAVVGLVIAIMAYAIVNFVVVAFG